MKTKSLSGERSEDIGRLSKYTGWWIYSMKHATKIDKNKIHLPIARLQTCHTDVRLRLRWRQASGWSGFLYTGWTHSRSLTNSSHKQNQCGIRCESIFVSTSFSHRIHLSYKTTIAMKSTTWTQDVISMHFLKDSWRSRSLHCQHYQQLISHWKLYFQSQRCCCTTLLEITKKKNPSNLVRVDSVSYKPFSKVPFFPDKGFRRNVF